jgi:hypothetical protein
MSANRSVQSAQRRRAGAPEPSVPGRGGPQPSINSAQMFSNQQRPGAAPNGRQPIQQSATGKLTIPQAITLITLRLGALETKMIEIDANGLPYNQDGQDSGILHSIMERLDVLENNQFTNGNEVDTTSTSNADVQLLKQQFEAVKQSVVQSKGISTTIVNENKTLKLQLDSLKKELNETKQMLTALQNLTLENVQKLDSIIETQMVETIDINNDFGEKELDQEYLEAGEQNEIIGTDLKALIESEINNSE